MRGRPTLPAQVKELKGTMRKHRVNGIAPLPSLLAYIPDVPSCLTERGAVEWPLVCSELQTMGMLYAVDLLLIAAYCNEMGVYWEMEELLRKNGRVMALKNEDGSLKYMQQVPQVAIGRNALLMAMRLAGQFGFTPAARAKMVSQRPETSDPFDDYLNGK